MRILTFSLRINMHKVHFRTKSVFFYNIYNPFFPFISFRFRYSQLRSFLPGGVVGGLIQYRMTNFLYYY